MRLGTYRDPDFGQVAVYLYEDCPQLGHCVLEESVEGPTERFGFLYAELATHTASYQEARWLGLGHLAAKGGREEVVAQAAAENFAASAATGA